MSRPSLKLKVTDLVPILMRQAEEISDLRTLIDEQDSEHIETFSIHDHMIAELQQLTEAQGRLLEILTRYVLFLGDTQAETVPTLTPEQVARLSFLERAAYKLGFTIGRLLRKGLRQSYGD